MLNLLNGNVIFSLLDFLNEFAPNGSLPSNLIENTLPAVSSQLMNAPLVPSSYRSASFDTISPILKIACVFLLSCNSLYNKFPINKDRVL